MLFLFDWGSCKLAAFAKSVAAQASFLSRLSHPTTVREVVGGRQQTLDLATSLAVDARPVIEKAIVRGAYEHLGTPCCRAHARSDWERPASPSVCGRQESGLPPVAGASDTIGMESLYYQRSGFGVVSQDRGGRIYFQAASCTRVPGMEKRLALSDTHNNPEV